MYLLLLLAGFCSFPLYATANSNLLNAQPAEQARELDSSEIKHFSVSKSSLMDNLDTSRLKQKTIPTPTLIGRQMQGVSTKGRAWSLEPKQLKKEDEEEQTQTLAATSNDTSTNIYLASQFDNAFYNLYVANFNLLDWEDEADDSDHKTDGDEKSAASYFRKRLKKAFKAVQKILAVQLDEYGLIDPKIVPTISGSGALLALSPTKSIIDKGLIKNLISKSNVLYKKWEPTFSEFHDMRGDDFSPTTGLTGIARALYTSDLHHKVRDNDTGENFLNFGNTYWYPQNGIYTRIKHPYVRTNYEKIGIKVRDADMFLDAVYVLYTNGDFEVFQINDFLEKGDKIFLNIDDDLQVNRLEIDAQSLKYGIDFPFYKQKYYGRFEVTMEYQEVNTFEILNYWNLNQY